MATTTNDSSPEDEQECSICLEVFISPCQLPCLHSFCVHCLQDYITKKASAKIGAFEDFVCPVCRAITVPTKKDKPVGEWASSFPTSPITLLAESKVKAKRLCDTCPSDGARNLVTKCCIECKDFMCDTCSGVHRKMRVSKNHQMVTIWEYENNPDNCLRFVEGLGCPAHHDKEIEFYCKSHEAACCGTCSFINHKTCNNVLELKTNLTYLLQEMNPQKIMEEMKKLHDLLNKFLEVNELNAGILESQINNISSELAKIRQKINAMLDDIEQTIKSEGNRIYKEEMIKKQEQNHQCQSLIKAIRNSHALLEMVSGIGTDTQKFLVTSKTMKQLQSYSDQIGEKFERVDSIKLMLDIDSHLKAVLSQDGRGLMKVMCKEGSEILHSTSNNRPLRECMVELARVVDVFCPSGQIPIYNGIIHLLGGVIVLAESNYKICCLYDSSYNCITMYTLPGRPSDMCLIDDNEVALTMPGKNIVQFLSIKDRAINDTGKITTRYRCYGLAAVHKREIVVSGHCGGVLSSSKKCYWSIISKDGKEKFHREFDCQWTDLVYIALNTSKSRVYISVTGGNAVYCFGLTDGRQYFVYTSNNLKSPHGVAVDRDDNVYVVGYMSHNIHKLSPDGVTLQIIASLLPEFPNRIFFISSREQFFLTNNSNEGRRTLHHFIHK